MALSLKDQAEINAALLGGSALSALVAKTPTVLSSSDDLNDIKTTGFYATDTGPVNRPDSGYNHWFIFVINYGDRVWQQAAARTGMITYERFYNEGTSAWTAWTRRLAVLQEATLSWNPGNLADGAGETSAAITVSGAGYSDVVLVSPPYSTQGILVYGYVATSTEVRIRIQNETGSAIDLGSGTWRVRLVR